MRIARPALIAALGLTLTATGLGTALAVTPETGSASADRPRNVIYWDNLDIVPDKGPGTLLGKGDTFTITGTAKSASAVVRNRQVVQATPKASEFRIWFRSAEQRDVTCTAQSPDGEVTGAHIRFIQKESADFTVTCRMNTERVQAVHYLTLAAHSEHSTVGESTGWSLRTATTNDAVLTFLGKRSIPGGKLAKTGS
ncbi:hypothetical protein [Granulicoccus phenolivorans]|uniref:hypothetical protein n=1 Tax=Granulicoccus phenolivorans TaxID=266854 RepID=UPI0004171553|nr:hypothetical protein [Granulicoccus phenolivorans]